MELKVKGKCGEIEVESERNIIYYRHVRTAYTLFPHLSHLCFALFCLIKQRRDKTKKQMGKQADGRSIPHVHFPTYMNMRGDKKREACWKGWAEDVILQRGREGIRVCKQELSFCFSLLPCFPCQQNQKWAMMKEERGRCTWGCQLHGRIRMSDSK